MRSLATLPAPHQPWARSSNYVRDGFCRTATFPIDIRIYLGGPETEGAVAELVGIEGGVVSGVINLESSGVEASDWRPRHDEPYHEA